MSAWKKAEAVQALAFVLSHRTRSCPEDWFLMTRKATRKVRRSLIGYSASVGGRYRQSISFLLAIREFVALGGEV